MDRDPTVDEKLWNLLLLINYDEEVKIQTWAAGTVYLKCQNPWASIPSEAQKQDKSKKKVYNGPLYFSTVYWKNSGGKQEKGHGVVQHVQWDHHYQNDSNKDR